MNWHIALFSELRPPNVKDSALEIDILSAQTQGFAHPHSCCHQQAKKCRIGVGAESLGRGELLCSAKELFNLFVAVDVRGFALVTMREERSEERRVGKEVRCGAGVGELGRRGGLR